MPNLSSLPEKGADDRPGAVGLPEELPLSAIAADRVITAARFLQSLPSRVLLALLWVYQHTLSPVLPVVLGPSCGCRFSPTCSHYAVEAVRVHGAVIGSFLSARRLLKCTPLHPGGFDPVPAVIRSRPSCRRSTPPAASTATTTIHRTSSRFKLTA